MAIAKSVPAPRSLQEWMERNQTNSVTLLAMVKERTGRSISPTMLSFILRGSRRCSAVNGEALAITTGVPFKVITEWPKVSQVAKRSGRRSSRAA